MGQWNKLIKSGSDAELNNLYVGNAVTASYFVGNGAGITGIVTSSYALTASYFLGQNYATFTQSTPATSWTFTHNLNNLHPVITVYDSGSRVTVPTEIYPSNANTTIINFPTSQSGYASATVGSVVSSAGISYLTGSCTFSFGFTGSFEGDFAETTINTVGLTSDNFRSFSYLPVTSSHHELDDFFVEGLDFKIQVINSNSTTGLVAFARENTWGDYTIKYNITYS